MYEKNKERRKQRKKARKKEKRKKGALWEKIYKSNAINCKTKTTFPGVFEWANKRTNERSGTREQSKQSGAS